MSCVRIRRVTVRISRIMNKFDIDEAAQCTSDTLKIGFILLCYCPKDFVVARHAGRTTYYTG